MIAIRSLSGQSGCETAPGNFFGLLESFIAELVQRVQAASGADAVMLQRLDEQIRDAYRHAEDCARRAKATRARQGRDDWLLLESRYLGLARSLEHRQRSELFVKEAEAKQKSPKRFRRSDTPKPPPNWHAAGSTT